MLTQQGTSLTVWDLVAPLALTGFGLGLLVVPLVDIALATVAVSDTGAASGVYSTFQQLGAAVGVAVSGSVFFGTIGAEWTQPATLEGLTGSACVAMAGDGLAAVASLLLPARAAVQARAEEVERAAAAEPVHSHG